jgi:hypothetical protein
MYDRATVRAFVEGINNDKYGVGKAIDAVVADLTRYYHQSNPSLPLQYISARRFGQDSAILQLQYGRRWHRGFTQSPLKVASFRSATWTTQWYRLPYVVATGAPAYEPGWIPTNANLITPHGEMQFHNYAAGTTPPVQDSTLIPKDWMWTQNAVRMFVPTVLKSNPLYSVANKLNRINSNSVQFGGMKFPRDTLLFEGVDVEWEEEANGQVMFYTNYSFLHCSHGFVMQNAVFDDEFGPPAWNTKQGLAYEEVSMTGFPL